ncbi:Lycopene beta-cyclase [Radiomyces spectabilis]|uniref:Lycopene beta-cyclase n=1 Tax=Radiomyces spectabilis TaxID=64574 RepID=UPI0022209F03|nr:Lycopene beta-cyclase [Radiomyces spectabilis]KAI8371524.1 Lycopene beta-cyclase [Radiomyces spectabilis]
MLTYMEVHLYYTLPVLGLLFWFLRPFHSSQDKLKYIFLCAVAFGTASPWDNYIVYHRAWSYCPECVTAVIGYVPLEEYMFFIIMTLMTVAFSNLVMRWHLPGFYLKPEKSIYSSMCVRYIPIIGFLTVGAKAWHLAVPATPLFYGSCILWYVCPVLALLWFGAGEYICRRWKAVLFSIAMPTLYLCWVDQVAIAAGTWDISRRTSSGIMVAPHLPLEEFMFFLMINVILVFATCAIDRAQAILHLYKTRTIAAHERVESSFLSDMLDLTWAFCQCDQALNSRPLKDLTVAWDILRQASYSFYTASSVFSFHARQDLGVLYGFCRATDDLADDESVSVEDRKSQLAATRKFVRELFSQKTNEPVINWAEYEVVLPESCVAAFRSFVRLRHVLEVDAVEELLEGYEWDLDRRPVQTEKDLIHYSACVASSVGEMCTRILMLSDPTTRSDLSVFRWTIARAREMGLVLQYTNIARDIVTDSEKLGRCYIPRDRLTNEEYNLISTGCARALGDQRLRELALELVHSAEEMSKRAVHGIARLPADCQGGVRAACNVYSAIGQALEQSHGYPTRAHVRGWTRAWICFKSVYGIETKLPTLLMKKVVTTRKGKVRSFIVD